MSALQDLVDLMRKYYRLTISFGGAMMPGDGWEVTIEAGGRKIRVGEHDLIDWNNEDAPYPEAEDVFRKALELFHSDRTPKKYRAIIPQLQENCPPELPEGMHYQLRNNNMVWLEFVASCEAEAMTKAKSCFPNSNIHIYETW